MKIYTNVTIFLNNGKREKGQLIIDTMTYDHHESYYCYYIFSNLWKGRGYYKNNELQNMFKGSYQITGYASEEKFLEYSIDKYLKRGLTRKDLSVYSNYIDVGWAWPNNVEKLTLTKDLYNYKKIEL